MASILQILRRIGGAKAAPATGKAGELALWKAGTAPADLRALYVHDGTQYIPLVDYATETLPGVAALATVAETDAGVVANKVVTPATLKTAIKELLRANRTLYVRPDGNDANKGDADTPARAFKTIAAAYAACLSLDINGFSLEIKVADGTYSAGLDVFQLPTGGGLTITGNIANPAACVINSTSSGFNFYCAVNVQVRGFSVSATKQALVSGRGATVVSSDMIFRACAMHIYLIDGSSLIMTNYTIAGNATVSHIYCTSGSRFTSYASTQVHIPNPVSVGTFISALSLSYVQYPCAVSGAGSTAVTGTKYAVSANSVIATEGKPATYLPGNAAGYTATGGQYT